MKAPVIRKYHAGFGRGRVSCPMDPAPDSFRSSIALPRWIKSPLSESTFRKLPKPTKLSIARVSLLGERKALEFELCLRTDLSNIELELGIWIFDLGI